MVKKETAAYLFIGQDSLSKDIKLKQLRQDLLDREVEQFNLDILYARELSLHHLQEKLLCIPVRAKRRLVVIRGAEGLKKEIKDFVLKYIRNPYPGVILVLDINSAFTYKGDPAQDEFFSHISKYSQVYRFKEDARPDTFMLGRYIEQRQSPYALRILNQLLKNGERPERILGGLRYVYQRSTHVRPDRRRQLKLILNCDLEIKTGRLKPSFALEKLVVNLCCLAQSFS